MDNLTTITKKTKKPNKLAKVEDAGKASFFDIREEFGLTVDQFVFVSEYVENGGYNADAIRAVPKYADALKAGTPAYTNAVNQALRWLSMDKVQKAISHLVQTQVMSADRIRAKFGQLSMRAKSEDIQLRATEKLARMADIDGNGGQDGKGGFTININMAPLEPIEAIEDIIDIELKN